jgi:hypothetical protein
MLSIRIEQFGPHILKTMDTGGIGISKILMETTMARGHQAQRNRGRDKRSREKIRVHVTPAGMHHPGSHWTRICRKVIQNQSFLFYQDSLILHLCRRFGFQFEFRYWYRFDYMRWG